MISIPFKMKFFTIPYKKINRKEINWIKFLRNSLFKIESQSSYHKISSPCNNDSPSLYPSKRIMCNKLTPP